MDLNKTRTMTARGGSTTSTVFYEILYYGVVILEPFWESLIETPLERILVRAQRIVVRVSRTKHGLEYGCTRWL